MATHKMVKVTLKVFGSGYVFKLADVGHEMANLLTDESLESEEVYEVRRVSDMTDKQIAALPEFEGW